MHRNVYIQILDATAADASPIYCASETPFTVAYDKPMPTDVMFHTIDDLRDGLRDRFGVPDLLIPGRAYFVPTPIEIEIGEELVFRVVAF